MRRWAWRPDDAYVVLAMYGAVVGLAWVLLDLFVYTRGWVPTRLGLDVQGFVWVLLYLPVYVALFTSSHVKAARPILLLGLTPGVILGVAGALALVSARVWQVLFGLLMVGLALLFLTTYASLPA